jgi:hypothetical protein
MVSDSARTSPLDKGAEWQPILDALEDKRRAVKPKALELDSAIRGVLLNLQSALALPGAVEAASIDDDCDPSAGLPDSYVEYMNHRRNYDYWNSAAVWRLVHQPSAGQHVHASNPSSASTSSICIAVVMSDPEKPFINVHIYRSLRLSTANRPRLIEIIERKTGLPVHACTLGDGCV